MLGLLGVEPSHGQRADSAATLRAARSAQARFETIRRHSTWTWSRGSGSCDERIGRFCLTHGDDDEDFGALPEPKKVQQARRELLVRLDSAAARVPGDRWIAGQRVRYSTKPVVFRMPFGQRSNAARRGWWCFALAGYARHTAGDFAGADSAFNRALNTMPSSRRRQWTDISVLVEGGGWRAYDRAQGAERDSLEQRFWWLADPLWMIPGNELRSEHLARHVIDHLQDRSRSTEGLSWGADLREITLRYGWPVGWERERPVSPTQTSPSIISHYAPRSRHFAPTPRSWPIPPAWVQVNGASTWSAPARRISPSLARFDDLEHQLATFRRGDSVLMVAAYALDADSVGAGPVEAGLVVARMSGRRRSWHGTPWAALPEHSAFGFPRACRAEPGGENTRRQCTGNAGSLRHSAGTQPAGRFHVGPAATRRRRQFAPASRGRHAGSAWLRPSPGKGAAGIVLGGVRASSRRGNRQRVRKPDSRRKKLAAPPRDSRPPELGRPAWGGCGLGRALAIALPDLPPGRYTLRVTVTPEAGTGRHRVTDGGGGPSVGPARHLPRRRSWPGVRAQRSTASCPRVFLKAEQAGGTLLSWTKEPSLPVSSQLSKSLR